MKWKVSERCSNHALLDERSTRASHVQKGPGNMSDDTQAKKTVDQRFWSRVDHRGPDECWPWRGAARGTYGGFYRAGRQVQAHRVAWELANGRAPRADLVVMHACDNRLCCNPSHLSEGTQRENSHDMMRKGRNDSRRGERHHRTKLTEKDVREIRSLAARGVRWGTIASDYRLSRGAVSDIITRRNWAEVSP